MNSHRSILRLPKTDFLVVYCKDPLQGLVLGFYRNVLALVVLCSPQVFPSVTVALGVVLTPHDRRKFTLCSLHLVASSTLGTEILAVVLLQDHPIMGSPKQLPLRKKSCVLKT